ncbi:hypothetical protein CR513_15888, partial [Mucuna pruriens]
MLTPMHQTSILCLDKTSKKVDQTSYKGMINSLLYLNASRPNNMFSVCLCACFQSDPRKSHLTPIKRIFRYLKDYDIIESNIHLLCDNIVAINLFKNLILHSCVKHIEIKHHFIRDHVQKEILDLKFIITKN